MDPVMILLVVAGVVAVAAAVRGTWSPCGLSMISAINPMAERSRGSRYWLTCAWFVAGSVVGGAVLGAMLSGLAFLVGLLPATGWLLVVATLAALVCVASDRRVGPQLPRIPRQVDETWLVRYRRWIYAAGFGVQIGAGFSTYVMTAANYLLVVLAALTGSPLAALLLGIGFGLVRGLTVLLTAGVHSLGDLLRLHQWLDRRDALSLRAVGAVQAGSAMVLASTAGWLLAGVPGLVVGGLLTAGLLLIILLLHHRADAIGCSVTPAPRAARTGAVEPV